MLQCRRTGVGPWPRDPLGVLHQPGGIAQYQLRGNAYTYGCHLLGYTIRTDLETPRGTMILVGSQIQEVKAGTGPTYLQCSLENFILPFLQLWTGRVEDSTPL
jgi:hypothetical protein